MKYDPKFRALLIRREQGRKSPERLWQPGDLQDLIGFGTDDNGYCCFGCLDSDIQLMEVRA
jgi:hypothetical protein